MAIDPGIFNYIAEFEMPTRVSDGRGGWTVTWTSLGTRWCAVRTISTREKVEYQQRGQNATVALRIFPLQGLTHECRAKMADGTYYGVIDIVDKDLSGQLWNVVVGDDGGQA